MGESAWEASQRRWRREQWRRRLVGVAWAILTGGLAVGGWFVGHLYWHDPTLGVFAGLFGAFLVWGMTDKRTRIEFAIAGACFAVGVPAIYVLALLTELPLLAAGIIPFSLHRFVVTPLLGAAVGTGLMVLWSLKGAYSKIAEPRRYGEERADFRETFLSGLSMRAAVAFVIAGGFIIPAESVAALVMLGALWGALSAVVQALFTSLLDREPLHDAWFRIILVEILLSLGLIVGLINGINDHAVFWTTLELIPPAAVACVATFGALELIAKIVTRLRTRRDLAASTEGAPVVSKVDMK